jgi:metallo-beta-lactamase family protein
VNLTFLGATETVTGSRYLLENGKDKILIDCGLFQGLKPLRLRNWEKFPINPDEINSVVLTHAHLDHSGYLPLLIKQGFKGKIYCTHATDDLCKILLPDSGHLQEELADFANRHGISKHKPALPLYTRVDAENSLSHFVELDYNKDYQLDDNLTLSLNYAGHILGASMALFQQEGVSILFTGDLGRFNDPIMKPPVTISHADYLVIESTYGDKLHSPKDPADELAEIVNRTIKRGGTIVIPAFAVGRAQEVLYYLYQLKTVNRIPEVQVYLDSPMAIDATEIFRKHTEFHKLSPELAKNICAMAKYTNTVEESKALDIDHKPKIIISASGMATGGRVLHHIKVFAGDERNTILFTGYQAEGTRGDLMVNHSKREIKMLGEIVKINAEVLNMNNLSAHADYEDIITWLKKFTKPPRKVFITHGEREAAYSLRDKIADLFNWECIVPTFLQREKLI